MQQKIDLTMYISDAAEVVHRAYYGQSVGVEMLKGPLKALAPPDDILSLCPVWLSTTKLSPARERILMDYAAIGLRHEIARELAFRFYAGLRSKKWRGKPTPAGVFEARKAWEKLGYQGNEHPLVMAIQQWRGWNAVQAAGWIYGNAEQTIKEIDVLWPKVKLAASRLRNGGELNSAAVRVLCGDILGAGSRATGRWRCSPGFILTAYISGLRLGPRSTPECRS